jgi:DNA-binding NtrC family response regulator
MDKAQTILVVDPDSDFLQWIQRQLETENTRVISTTTADQALKLYTREEPDILIAETHLTPVSGQELLVKVRQRNANAIVVLTSQFGTTQAVIEAMKLGAFDFVRKEQLPFTLKGVVDAALKAQADLKSATAVKAQLTIARHAAGLQDGGSRRTERCAGDDHR